ncbi:ORF51 [Ranid herpesvirus 2]|uniref:ORF51 n=1 Tax=Ranid herpesvirus 2 TaxID=389214 RepID=Q14W55_9VIRU|nr:ORF51 [Ranid herpesvirus 2]ABG25649.1 ORF51 [Ranid herpesvirus 2]
MEKIVQYRVPAWYPGKKDGDAQTPMEFLYPLLEGQISPRILDRFHKKCGYMRHMWTNNPTASREDKLVDWSNVDWSSFYYSLMRMEDYRRKCFLGFCLAAHQGLAEHLLAEVRRLGPKNAYQMERYILEHTTRDVVWPNPLRSPLLDLILNLRSVVYQAGEDLHFALLYMEVCAFRINPAKLRCLKSALYGEVQELTAAMYAVLLVTYIDKHYSWIHEKNLGADLLTLFPYLYVMLREHFTLRFCFMLTEKLRVDTRSKSVSLATCQDYGYVTRENCFLGTVRATYGDAVDVIGFRL